MKRSRARLGLLGWLVVVLTCVSVCTSEEEVVAEADEIAKKIEEESKKVDIQSDAMVKAIDRNVKNVDDPEQEKKFEEASKRVDDVADISDQEVEDKANKAEEKANEAERRVEEIGRRIEANSDSNKRSIINNQTDSTDDPKSKSNIDTQEDDSKKKVIEPSKVVILPDNSIRGTDAENMQIKELKSKSSHGIWLAVHIPDNATVPRPVRILSTKKAADDLERVIGPNKETMFKELQTIIGVDSATLKKMLRAGQVQNIRHRKRKHHYDDYNDDDEDAEQDDDNEADDDEDDDDDDNSGEDDDADCGDDDDDDDDDDDEYRRRKHRKHRDKGSGSKCKKQSAKIMPWVMGKTGSGLGVTAGKVMNDDAHAGKGVYQPSGYKQPLADLFNKFIQKNKKKKVCSHATHPLIQALCKEMSENHGHHNPNHPRRHHLKHIHNKYYRHLKHLMRKFLDRHNGAQAKKVLDYMNLLLSDQLRLSSDGVVHLYPNRGKPNSYRDGFKALVNDEDKELMNDDPNGDGGGGDSLLSKAANTLGLPLVDPPNAESDDPYNGHVIRIPIQASTRGMKGRKNFGVVSPLQANILNNQVHTKLGDIHSADDLQMQSFKEEMGRTNDEMFEQQKEAARDKAIMDKYLFRVQSLAEKGPVVNWAGMQKDAAARVNGQQVSVVNQDQISLHQARIPYKNNADVPSLGGYVGGRFKGFSKRNQIKTKTSLTNPLKRRLSKHKSHSHRRSAKHSKIRHSTKH